MPVIRLGSGTVASAACSHATHGRELGGLGRRSGPDYTCWGIALPAPAHPSHQCARTGNGLPGASKLSSLSDAAGHVRFIEVGLQVTVGAVNAMASKSPAIMAALRRLHALCLSWDNSIKAEYLPSAANVYAGRLSREHDSTSSTLAASAFKELDEQFGPHTVDLFATHLSARCGRFYSHDWTSGCSGVRALGHDWTGENGWANPPFNLLPTVVDKALCSDCDNAGGPPMGSSAMVLASDGWERGGDTPTARGRPASTRNQSSPAPEARFGRGRLPF